MTAKLHYESSVEIPYFALIKVTQSLSFWFQFKLNEISWVT